MVFSFKASEAWASTTKRKPWLLLYREWSLQASNFKLVNMDFEYIFSYISLTLLVSLCFAWQNLTLILKFWLSRLMKKFSYLELCSGPFSLVFYVKVVYKWFVCFNNFLFKFQYNACSIRSKRFSTRYVDFHFQYGEKLIYLSVHVFFMLISIMASFSCSRSCIYKFEKNS